MIIVLDTETTGLPANYQAPVSNVGNWPRAVEISWGLFMNGGMLLRKHSYIILPSVYEIPAEATAKHGITTEQALAEGTPITGVLEMLLDDMQNADYIVAHNMDFDSCILGAEYIRIGMTNPFESLPLVCTMQASTEYCKLPGKNGGFKWPRLSELYATLFHEPLEEEHRAEVDMLTCARCYFELVKRGVIECADTKNEQPVEEAFAPTPTFEEYLEKQFMDAFEAMRQARTHFFTQTDQLARLQYKLEDLRAKALIENRFDGKNEEARKAQAREAFGDTYQAIAERESEERLARLNFDLAQAEVDLLRYRLRIAEMELARGKA
jgi:DNA polymerase III subunit epsilon